MATRLSRRLAHSLKGRLYSTQVASTAETAVRGNELKVTKVKNVGVATMEGNAAISRVVFAIKAGSKYENPSSMGMTHVIRQISQLTNEKVTYEELIEDLQGLGASLSFDTSRDNSYITLTGLKEHIFDAVSLVYPAITRDKFLRTEYEALKGFVPKIQYDLSLLDLQPEVKCIEALHAAAFTGGLGNSLYATKDNAGSFTPYDIISWVTEYYRPERMSVVATGVLHNDLEGMVNLIDFKEDTSSIKEPEVKFNGGQRWVPLINHPVAYFAMAYKGPSLNSPDALPAAVLQQILGTGPHLKYKLATTSGRLNSAADKYGTVECYNANYADSGLFGFFGMSTEDNLGQCQKAAEEELNKVLKNGVSDEEVARGKNMLKAFVAYDMESGYARALKLADQVLAGAELSSLREVLKKIDSIQTADVNRVGKSIGQGEAAKAGVGALKTCAYL